MNARSTAPIRVFALAALCLSVSCTGRSVVLDGAPEAAPDDIAEDIPQDVPMPPQDTGIDATLDVASDVPIDSGIDVERRTDEEIIAACLSCHSAIAPAWQHLSSHHLLFNCTVCHRPLLADAGPGHVSRPACSDCHSEVAHPSDTPCVRCHDPHGSANAFLIAESITLPDDAGTAPVHVTALEGATPDGLVHYGVPDAGGTGLCEVCHTTTTHYNRSATGIVHYPTPCNTCHEHTRGFAPPA